MSEWERMVEAACDAWIGDRLPADAPPPTSIERSRMDAAIRAALAAAGHCDTCGGTGDPWWDGSEEYARVEPCSDCTAGFRPYAVLSPERIERLEREEGEVWVSDSTGLWEVVDGHGHQVVDTVDARPGWDYWRTPADG